MITLHQYPRLMGVPNSSPFCLKLETWLKMAEIPYDVHELGDPRGTPKGKLPYITHDGVDIADSALAIQYLQKNFQVNLDAALTPKDKGIAHAVSVMLEEHLYWAVAYNRWLGDNWPKLKRHFFSALPPIVNKIVPGFIQKRVKSDLEGQGMGRHTEEDIYGLALKDLQSVVDILGDQHYLMGDQPCTADATVFAFLCNIVNVPLASPLKEFVQRSPSLMAYNQRMGERYFPEFFTA